MEEIKELCANIFQGTCVIIALAIAITLFVNYPIHWIGIILLFGARSD